MGRLFDLAFYPTRPPKAAGCQLYQVKRCMSHAIGGLVRVKELPQSLAVELVELIHLPRNH